MSVPVPPQYDRWIISSATKWFYDLRGSTPAYIEGMENNGGEEYFEIRVDGPYYTEKTHGQYFGDIEINILCTVKVGSDIYKIHRLTGRVAQMFRHSIPVFRFGSESEDPMNDGGLIGHLERRLGRRESLRKTMFGTVRPGTGIIQASLEDHYQIRFGVEEWQHLT